jgi:Xaa-Pro aminopeptidase
MPAQSKIYRTLRRAFDEATSRLEIGRPVSEVFVAGLNAARAAGLPTYTRGNLGHGVGLHPAPELPIVSREEPRLLTPGHVISVEVPYYVDGIGALTVEDTFAVTEGGVEVFNRLSRDLVEIDT